MLGWQEATHDPKEKILKDVGKKALADAIRARACIKRSDRVFEKFRRDVENEYLVQITHHAADTVDAH